jgi:hypothetical protein
MDILNSYLWKVVNQKNIIIWGISWKSCWLVVDVACWLNLLQSAGLWWWNSEAISSAGMEFGIQKIALWFENPTSWFCHKSVCHYTWRALCLLCCKGEYSVIMNSVLMFLWFHLDIKKLWRMRSFDSVYRGKAIPLQAWTGPEDSRRLRFPDFKTVSTWRW